MVEKIASVEHEPVLATLSRLLTRDDQKHFTQTDRLDRIKEYLKESEYEIMEEKPLAVLYKKKDVVLPEKVVLLSSHVDCFEEIKEGRFESVEDYYAGTFDNAATNAAVVIAMLENELSENVIVAFTGDEEEGCKGAKKVSKYLENEGKKYIAIALDITFDLESEPDKNGHTNNTYEYASYTIDNIHKNSDEKIVEKLFDIAKKMEIRFMVTRADGHDFFGEDDEPKPAGYYPREIEVKDSAYSDEAITYGKKKYCNCIAAFSLCLPSDDHTYESRMHTSKPVKIRMKAFEEYIKAVAGISKSLSKSLVQRK